MSTFVSPELPSEFYIKSLSYYCESCNSEDSFLVSDDAYVIFTTKACEIAVMPVYGYNGYLQIVTALSIPLQKHNHAMKVFKEDVFPYFKLSPKGFAYDFSDYRICKNCGSPKIRITGDTYIKNPEIGVISLKKELFEKGHINE